MLIILAGLPGTGKSTLGRALAQRLGATWLRIDSIEQAIRESGVAAGSVEDAGYRAAYALAEDNLRLGRTVIADSVNPVPQSREAWRDVAARVCCDAIDVELICSDEAQHRYRIEARPAEVPGLKLPTWQEVCDRDYHSWDRDRIVLDTADKSVDQCVEELLCRAPSLAERTPDRL